MYHSNIFKTILWVLIVLDLTYFLLLRSSSFISGSATFFDSVVFVSWIITCFIPVFVNAGIFEFHSRKNSNEAHSDGLRAHGT